MVCMHADSADRSAMDLPILIMTSLILDIAISLATSTSYYAARDS